jgi:hypothetical protein
MTQRSRLMFSMLVCTVFMIVLVPGTLLGQSIIARWNFEGVTTNNTGSDAVVSGGSAQADSGALTVGSLFSAHHVSASTVWSNPAGNGSTKSVSSNNWTTTGTPADYFQFQFSTTNYSGIVVSWDQTGSNTGPRDFKVQYSTDGTSFTDATGSNSVYSITNDSWSTTTNNPASTRTLNLSGVSSLNNQYMVYIRFLQNSTIAINGGAVATSGTGRIDNFAVSGFAPFADGDGSATLVNNSGMFAGSSIFARNTGGQTVLITVTGVAAGTLTQVRLTVPSMWTNFSGSNVTLGGAFAGNTPVIAGNQITINSAGLGTTPGTIEITGLTSANPVGPLANDTVWTVETAKSGGTLTPIAFSPRSHTIIPIQNMRTGGVDGFGNANPGGSSSAMAGQIVAIQGVATVPHGVLNTTSFTSFFVQENGYGMQIFRAGSPSVTWIPGDIIVVKGTVTDFNGGMEVIPASGSSPDFYNIGAGSLPSPLVLANAASVDESNEGKLVQLNSVIYDSAGQQFIASTVNRGRNNYRTSPTDTGSVWLHGGNPIVGKTIPATGNIVGVVYQRNDHTGAGQPARKIAPRGLIDLGIDPADGTGIAAISPTVRFSSQSAVAETLTVTGDGTNTIAGVGVTLPSSWTWDGSSRVLEGTGFSGATSSVTGDGSSGNPWLITVSNAAVTNLNTGVVRIQNLGTPVSPGSTTFLTATRGATGLLTPVASSPAVNIITAFEAVSSGNWSNPATWAGGQVPGSTDNVTLSTLHTTVTIDVANAVCNNLTMTGSGNDTTGGGTGPVLRFADTGSPQLTVNGNLVISGGGGSGNRGGRSQLTSNDNPNATLVVKKNLVSSSSNSIANGSAGMNMHEGTVKLTGSTADTLRFGASMRLGHLEIGDGASAKTVVTAITTSTGATVHIRSLKIRQGSSFMIGTLDNTYVLTVGNPGTAGIPMLNGGIIVESGATFMPQLSFAGLYVANINLNGGGITNNGTFNMLSFGLSPQLTHCYYILNVGVSGASKQTLNGTNPATLADVVIAAADTLRLEQDMIIPDEFKMTVNGVLEETAGNTVVGPVEATRTVTTGTNETFGGIGLELNATGTAPGQTLARRVTGVPSSGGGNTSILRYFDITPSTNTGLNATLLYFYDNSELDGQNASTLQLWKSTNTGSTWSAQGGTVNVGLRRIELTGVNDLSRWTASDAQHPLGGSSTVTLNVPIGTNWNIVSLPVGDPTPNDSVRRVFENSVNAYAYAFVNNQYVQRFTLSKGPGYWIKSSTSYTQAITGTPVDSLTIPVVNNWNMIGSISSSIDTSSARVTPNPAGLRASVFYQFNISPPLGYQAATTIVPGRGYWVKANGAGTFHMHIVGVPRAGKTEEPAVTQGKTLDDLHTLTIEDATGGSQTLYFGADGAGEIPVLMYEMPPLPPAGMFDARFSTATGGYLVQTHPAEISGTAASYELSDGAGGVQTLRGEGTMRIGGSNSHLTLRVTGSGTLLPKEYALYQNYPNPFNPTTTIKYALPVDSKVTVEMYNIIGQRVRTLVSTEQAAGYYLTEWNGTNDAGAQLASGMYFMRMSAEGTNGKTFTDVRKTMMLK